MTIEEKIKDYIQTNTDSTVLSAELVGKGASGCVFKITTDKEPTQIAVKYSEYPKLLKDEYTMHNILESARCKSPKTYFFAILDDGTAVMGLEFINGINGANKKLKFMPNKKHLANNIVDNLIKIHSIKNDKFGSVFNPVYDTWNEYYKDYSSEIFRFCKTAYDNNRLNCRVMDAVRISFEHFDEIFIHENNAVPTLTHGDYWMPNFIIDTKNMELAGLLDPYDMKWSEPEYELFTLTVGYGKNLKLYELYTKKTGKSAFCDMKLEYYALYNELNWYKSLGTIGEEYLLYRSKRLIKQMKKNKII